MDLHDDILRLSQRIAELAGADDADVDLLEELVHDRDHLIRGCFAAPIPAESADETAVLIRTVLELDSETCLKLRSRQQRIGENLGFLRRSQKAAGAYAATEQD